MANKADRLREFLRDRKDAPLVPVPSRAQWDNYVEEAELTPDDLKLLSRQVAGHQERARSAQVSADLESLVFEAAQALALDPFNDAFVLEVAGWIKTVPASTPELEALRKRVSSKKKSPSLPGWLLAVLVGSMTLVAAAVALFIWQPWQPAPGSVAPIIRAERHPIGVEWSTGAVKTEVSLQKNVLEVYAEARVLDVSGVVVFPDTRVGLWVARLVVTDSAGSVLFQTDKELHGVSDGPLEPGQGLPFSLQYDAASWLGDPVTLKIETLQIESAAAKAEPSLALTVTGIDRLTKGFALSVSQVNSQWKTRFATRANQLNLELRNSGLKPFRMLKFAVEWRDRTGQILKTTSWNPISEYRTELVAGGHLSATIETIFETELFPWSEGQEPHPVVQLVGWK